MIITFFFHRVVITITPTVVVAAVSMSRLRYGTSIERMARRNPRHRNRLARRNGTRIGIAKAEDAIVTVSATATGKVAIAAGTESAANDVIGIATVVSRIFVFVGKCVLGRNPCAGHSL